MISVALRYQQEHRTTKYMTMTISPYSWIRNAKLATSTISVRTIDRPPSNWFSAQLSSLRRHPIE